MSGARAGRVLVLGVYRDSELTHDHPLVDVVADLRRQGVVERLSLSGLDDVGVRNLVEAASGHSLDEAGLALAQAIYEETEGNPFFVGEVLRHLAETGGVQRREGVWTTELPVEQLGIPEGVREAVGQRLSRLSGDTNQALRVAAVIGPEFELAVVRAAGDLSEEAVLGAVEEAAEARLVSEVSATRFRFAHALVRATVYESLTAARKVTLHRKAAEAIETMHEGALDDYVPALAHHWAKASAPVTDPTRAVEYAQKAGDRALTQLAHDEAARYYASGLGLLDAAGADLADARRLELLIGAGEAQRRAGDPDYRRTLLDAAHMAREMGDARSLARAALANTLGYMWTAFAVDADRVEILDAAIAAIGGDDLAVRARLLATLGLELTWQPDPTRRLALSEEAVQIARALDDSETLAHVLLARDYTISDADNVAERLTATDELLAIAERLGDPVIASRALGLRYKAQMELAAVAEAERALVSNEALVADLGQPGLAWSAQHHRAALAVLHGEPDAEQRLKAVDELGRSIAEPEVLSVCRRFWVRIEQGRVDDVSEFFRLASESAAAPPVVRAVYAHILDEKGEPEAAARVLDEFAATGFAQPRNNVGWLLSMAECAWLTARLGRKDCVPPLRSMLEPYADQLAVAGFASWIGGSVSLYLAMLSATVGDYPQAEADFAGAAATHERIGAPGWLARTRVEWARMLLARTAPGDAERADDYLRQALTTARDLGLRNIERSAAELLLAQGN